MSKPVSRLQQRIDKLRNEMDDKVAVLLAEARATFVIPYCDKHKLRFTAGMGTYSFDGPKGYIWTDDLPKYLRRVLDADVYTSRNDAGSLMEDYTSPNYVRKPE